AILFSVFIHIGDPDQALTSIPALCVIGGGVLAGLLDRVKSAAQSVLPSHDRQGAVGQVISERALMSPGSRRLGLAVAAVAAVHSLIFFVPPGRLARASSYRAVSGLDRRMRLVFGAISDLESHGRLTIVERGAIVSWRQLSYYFPQDYVVDLPDRPGQPAMTLFRRRALGPAGAPRMLDGAGTVVLLAPGTNPQALHASGVWRQYGPVFYRDVAPGEALTIGSYHLDPETPPLISLVSHSGNR
ncbi:MAG: hypothetical protein ABI165_06945, partial [Bryobacteraceae bacterium]